MEKQPAKQISPLIASLGQEVVSEYNSIVSLPIINSPIVSSPLYQQKLKFGVSDPAHKSSIPRNDTIVRKMDTSQSQIMDNSILFREDSAQKKKMNPKVLLQMNNNVRWHWSIFFEFLFYHVTYFFVLGPFITLFFFFKPGMKLLRNMDFFGLSVSNVIQTSIYLTNMFSSVLFFIDGNWKLHLSEMVYFWALIFNLCLIISAKYATFSQDMIEILKNFTIEKSVKSRLQYLYFYTPQTPQARYVELYSAFARHQFESSLFYVTFFTETDEIFAESINSLNLQLKKFHKNSQAQYQPDALITYKQQFYGFGIANKLIQVFEDKSSWKMPFIYSYLLSLGMSLMPILYIQLNCSMNITRYRWIQLIMIIICETYCGFICLIFLFASLRDVKKKKFLLTQCGYMISHRKAYWDSRKIIPTINITDVQSIMAWSMLRQIFFDYGKQYTIRTQSFYSFIIFYCLIDSVLITLYFFKIIVIDNFSMIYLIATDVIFVVMIILILVEQAHLNSFFSIYRSLIEDWINIILDIQRMKQYYFGKEIDPNNYLHRKIVELISDQINNNQDDEIKEYEDDTESDVVENYLKGLQKTMEDALRHLEYDKRNYSYKFYGFVVTFEKLWAFVVGFSTIIGFNINYWIKYK